MAEYGYPPFSDEVSVADLIVVDYTLLVQGDADEIEKLWQAATELGMWYLKNHGVENEVEGMFGVAEKTLMLPRREKKKYAHWKEEGLFGYNLNKGGRDPETKEKLELAEYINIAKDDILSYPTPVYRTYPSPIADNIEATIRPFVQKSCNVTDTLLEVFNDKLGLPQGTLAQRHSAQERSSSQVRLTRSFGNPAAGSASLFQPHNDYGLLAFSYARLGGLLVMGKGWISWKWVKPIPGHAVCIVGETLDTFTYGILRSVLHQVTTPAGAQEPYERWSVNYLARAGDSGIMAPMAEESAVIAETVARMKQVQGANYDFTDVHTVGAFWWKWTQARRNQVLCDT